MRTFLFFILLLVAPGLYAQEKPGKNEETNARTAGTNATGVTYTYDSAGNRIKRVGGVMMGCLNVWTGNVSSSWNNAGNWSLGVVPQPSHIVEIPILSGKPNPVLNVNTTISSIRFTGGNINTNNFNIIITLATCTN